MRDYSFKKVTKRIRSKITRFKYPAQKRFKRYINILKQKAKICHKVD